MSIELTRRGLMLGGLALTVSGCMSTLEEPVELAVMPTEPVAPAAPEHPPVDPKFDRQRVAYNRSEPVGTIVVDTTERFLYAVEEDGMATRYGVAVAEAGLSLKGEADVGRKAEWPFWTPTAEMIQRKPHLAQYNGGVPGGPENPLGARALYLYRDGRDTMYRLHGTNEPWSIGTAASSGCIRLRNEDAIHLYERTPVGAKVIVV